MAQQPRLARLARLARDDRGTMRDLWTALALVLVIEGALYALFPEGMKRAAARALTVPPQTLRLAGLAAACAGVVLVWLVRR
ncbi:MAG TPA: DUF2065 domain-containing protein [Stellaceae bacterium]|nr:DUF2065 domain-containing protein [Stellaceae bacterium]